MAFLPVPAPATAELLAGKPVYARGPALELTTPTGAAIVATLAASFGRMPPMRVLATGYGAGDNDFPEHANVLRAIIGETSGAQRNRPRWRCSKRTSTTPVRRCWATPWSGCSKPARWTSRSKPLLMKKNRPGTLLRVIARPEDQESLAQLIFAETTTLGLRIYEAERRVKARTIARSRDAARDGPYQGRGGRLVRARIRRLPRAGARNRNAAQSRFSPKRTSRI